MIKLHNQGVTLQGGVPTPAKAAFPAGRDKTMAYQILRRHDRPSGDGLMHLTFDSLISHDITYVGVIQTAKASGMTEFPVPYVLTNCHNSLCAVGGTINEDDHVFGLSAAVKYGGDYVPANQAVIQVVKGLDGNAKQIRRSIFIGFGLSSVFVLIVTGTVLLGTKGALEKELAYMQLGESIGTWAMILAGVFSLFALLTTFWSNTLALRDVVHEQIGSGNRISWLIATVPCILFAVFGVNSFIVLTRIMSGVVVLVSIILVLTYGKSRKKAGSSPICGVIGTVPFQVLMVISTVLSAIGALIPLS